jgi:3-dehydroquinate synthetase
MCSETIRPRVIDVLKKCDLFRVLEYDWKKITQAVFHDKKADGDTVTVIRVNEIGSFEIQEMTCFEVIEISKTVLEGLGE